VTTVAAADVNGSDPDGKPVTLPEPNQEILKTAFATDQGDTSRVAQAQDGTIFALHVDKVIAPPVRPLAEVLVTLPSGRRGKRRAQKCWRR